MDNHTYKKAEDLTERTSIQLSNTPNWRGWGTLKFMMWYRLSMDLFHFLSTPYGGLWNLRLTLKSPHYVKCHVLPDVPLPSSLRTVWLWFAWDFIDVITNWKEPSPGNLCELLDTAVSEVTWILGLFRWRVNQVPSWPQGSSRWVSVTCHQET